MGLEDEFICIPGIYQKLDTLYVFPRSEEEGRIITFTLGPETRMRAAQLTGATDKEILVAAREFAEWVMAAIPDVETIKEYDPEFWEEREKVQIFRRRGMVTQLNQTSWGKAENGARAK